MKSTKILLGERIKELRKNRGMTQEQLAELVDIEQKHVSRIELGKNAPTIDRLERIAEVLDTPVKEFFDFIHLADRKTKAQSLEKMLKELDEERQILAYRVCRSVIREMKEK